MASREDPESCDGARDLLTPATCQSPGESDPFRPDQGVYASCLGTRGRFRRGRDDGFGRSVLQQLGLDLIFEHLAYLGAGEFFPHIDLLRCFHAADLGFDEGL